MLANITGERSKRAEKRYKERPRPIKETSQPVKGMTKIDPKGAPRSPMPKAASVSPRLSFISGILATQFPNTKLLATKSSPRTRLYVL